MNQEYLDKISQPKKKQGEKMQQAYNMLLDTTAESISGVPDFKEIAVATGLSKEQVEYIAWLKESNRSYMIGTMNESKKQRK